MKSIVFKISLLCILTISLYSCKEEGDSYDISKVTYFPAIEIAGESLEFIGTGESFTPSAMAMEGEEVIDVVIDNPVDNTTPGTYEITFSAVNKEGYTKSAVQTVIVYDSNVNTADISGTYSGDVVRNGSESYSNIPVTLTKVEGLDGVYTITDWIAGFYADGRGGVYTSAYRFRGYIQINASNEVVLLYMTNPWGDPFDDVVGSYDPGTQTISYTANWLDGTYAFVVNLVK